MSEFTRCLPFFIGLFTCLEAPGLCTAVNHDKVGTVLVITAPIQGGHHGLDTESWVTDRVGSGWLAAAALRKQAQRE